ncbi:MAG: hypothetical protein LV468_04745 [Candidatus Nitrosotenuis sp.]|nr:hypothetical protein [Candidatus Nitrosotenuis sp.]
MADEKDFVDMCAVCKQGVPKSDMVYQKGKVFHTQCFTDHGGSFPAPNHELNHMSSRTRIELVQLKNLMVRSEAEATTAKTAKAAKKAGKKPKRAKPKRSKPKSKKPKSRAKSRPKKKAKKSRTRRR